MYVCTYNVAYLEMTFIKIGIRLFLSFLSIWWCFNLLTEYDNFLKEEYVSFMAPGEEGSTDRGIAIPHIEGILCKVVHSKHSTLSYDIVTHVYQQSTLLSQSSLSNTRQAYNNYKHEHILY